MKAGVTSCLLSNTGSLSGHNPPQTGSTEISGKPGFFPKKELDKNFFFAKINVALKQSTFLEASYGL
jgi:hypothetical protein